MTATRYDLIVIGAGMAGVNAAHKCAAAGWRVAIVDALPYGGTCALRGCDPKKILRRGAEIIDAARLLAGKGIDANGLAINWADLMGHTRGFTDPVPQRMEDGLHASGVQTLHGQATFTGPTTLVIGEDSYDAAHVLIATGARPRSLDLPGAHHLIDSTAFLRLPRLPQRILFVGGGFVSFEFAHIAARAGSTPTIIDRGERPLKGFDADLVERLVTRSRHTGITVRPLTSLQAVEPAGDGYRVTLGADGTQTVEEVDLVVHGAGRTPHLDGLDLEAAGVAHGPDGVRVSGHLQSTTNPAVWAAGDAADTPGMPLTPVAVFEGKVAASNMLKDQTTVPDYDGVPAGVFTVPELVRVGPLEPDARARYGDELDVRCRDTSGWYANYRTGETTAATKLLIHTPTDTIVGAHLLGPDYAEVVNIFALAITLGLTTRQLKSATPAYPTVGGDLGSML